MSNTNTLNTKFKLRRDTLTNWTTNNPTIAAGEPILVFDEDDIKIKIGKEPNGSTFNNTEYYGGDWDSLLNKPFYDELISGESYEIDLTQLQVGQRTFDADAGVVGHFYQISEQYYDIDTLKTFTCDYEMIDDSGAPMTQEQDVLLGTLVIEENAMPGITAIMIGDFPFFLAIMEEVKIGADTYPAGLYGVHGEVPSYCTWTGLKLTAPDRVVTHKIDSKYVDTSMDALTGTTQLPNVNLSVPENGSEYDFYAQVDDYYGFEIYQLGAQMTSENFSNLKAQTTEWNITISQSDDDDIILSELELDHGDAYIKYNGSPRFTILNIESGRDISQWLDGDYISSKNPVYIQNSGLYLIQGIYHEITNLQGLNYTDSWKKVKSISYTLDGGSSVSLFSTSNNPLDGYSYSGAPNTIKMHYVGDTIIDRNEIDGYSIVIDGDMVLNNELAKTEYNRNFSDTWEYKGRGIDLYLLADSDGYSVLVAHEDNLISDSKDGSTSFLQTFTVPKAGTYLAQQEIYKINTNYQPYLYEQTAITSISRLNQKNIQSINSDYIKLPWENIINAPFGEVRVSPYYIQGPVDYEELMSTETTEMSAVGISAVKIGDYIDPQKLDGTAKVSLSALRAYTGENNSFELEEEYLLNSGQFYKIDNNSIRWESQQGINLLFVSGPTNVFGGTFNRGIYSMLFTDNCQKEDEFGNTIYGTVYYALNKIDQNFSNIIKKLDSKYIDTQYTNLSDKPFGVGRTQTYDGPWSADIKKADLSSAFQISSNHYLSINNLGLTYDQFRGLEGYWGIENTSTHINTQSSYYYNYGNYANLINIIRRQDEENIYYLAYNKDTNFDYPELIYIPSTNESSSCGVILSYDQDTNLQYLSKGTLYIRKKEISQNEYEGFYNLNFVSYTNNYTIHIDPLYLTQRTETEETPISKYNLITSNQDSLTDSYYTIQNLSGNFKFSTNANGIDSDFLTVNTEAEAKFVFYNKNDYSATETLYYYFLNSEGSFITPNADDYQIYISAVDGDNLFESGYSIADPHDGNSIGLPSIPPGQHHIWIKFKNIANNEDLYRIRSCNCGVMYVPTLEGYIKENIDISNLDTSVITTGVFNTNQIPDLNASKITSGTFNENQIPNLSASKITSGIFDSARIPALSASKITSGIFDSARIPALSASKITSGTFDSARIPDLDASKITSGVFDSSKIRLSLKDVDNKYSIKDTLSQDSRNSDSYVDVTLNNQTVRYYKLLEYAPWSGTLQGQERNYSTIKSRSWIDNITFNSSDWITLESTTLKALFDANQENIFPYLIYSQANNYTALGATFDYATTYVSENLATFTLEVYDIYGKVTWNNFNEGYAFSYNGFSSDHPTFTYNGITYERIDDFTTANKLSTGYIQGSKNYYFNHLLVNTANDIVTVNIEEFLSDQPFIYSNSNIMTINGQTVASGTWMAKINPLDTTTDYSYYLRIQQRKAYNTIPAEYLTTSATAGQILTYNGYNWVPENVPTELPDTSNNEGAVLRVVSGEWRAVQLPSASGQSF